MASAGVGAQFEALFLSEMLKPLKDAFGEQADVLIAPLAQSIAQRDANGFGALVERQLEPRQ